MYFSTCNLYGYILYILLRILAYSSFLTACFAGGMWALASEHTDDSMLKILYQTNGAELTRTCHESYERSGTELS